MKGKAMSMIFDLAIVAIALISVIAAAKRGFVRSIGRIASIVVAYLVAHNYSENLSRFFYDRFVLGWFSDSVSGTVDNLLTKGENGFDISKLFEDLPEAFTSLLERFGIDLDALAQKYAGLINGSGTEVSEMTDTIASPLAMATASVLAFLAIFFGTLLVCFLIIRLVDLICQLPVLKTANHLLGALVGCLSGLLYVWVFAAVALLVIRTVTATTDSIIFLNTVENSFILKYFVDFNPIAALFGLNT